MLRLEQILKLHFPEHPRMYTIHPGHHYLQEAETHSRSMSKIYEISRILNPNSLELQTLLQAAHEENFRVSGGAIGFPLDHLNPPDFHRALRILSRRMQSESNSFSRWFLRGKRKELESATWKEKAGGDWNPRVGKCSKQEWLDFYPLGIPAYHVGFVLPIFDGS